jgi:hypothetical protein
VLLRRRVIRRRLACKGGVALRGSAAPAAEPFADISNGGAPARTDLDLDAASRARALTYAGDPHTFVRHADFDPFFLKAHHRAVQRYGAARAELLERQAREDLRFHAAHGLDPHGGAS